MNLIISICNFLFDAYELVVDTYLVKFRFIVRLADFGLRGIKILMYYKVTKKVSDYLGGDLLLAGRDRDTKIEIIF